MIAPLPDPPDLSCLLCRSPLGAAAANWFCETCGDKLTLTGERIVLGADADRTVNYPVTGADDFVGIEDDSFWFRHRNRVLETVLALYPPAGRIMDVGGGNGFQALMFQKAGHSTLLMEPSVAGCRNAHRRGVRDIACGTLEGFNLAAESLSAVSVLDVIEHLDDPALLLAEIRRVLAPNGRLYVTVPAHSWLWSDHDVYARHKRRYSQATLDTELTAAGFRTDYLTYYFAPLLVPALLLRTLPYRLRLQRRKPEDVTMNAGQHTPGRWQSRVLGPLLDRELGRIRARRHQRFGSSVLAVAHKTA